MPGGYRVHLCMSQRTLRLRAYLTVLWSELYGTGHAYRTACPSATHLFQNTATTQANPTSPPTQPCSERPFNVTPWKVKAYNRSSAPVASCCLEIGVEAVFQMLEANKWCCSNRLCEQQSSTRVSLSLLPCGVEHCPPSHLVLQSAVSGLLPDPDILQCFPGHCTKL